jgi:protein tyrosine phosphatase
LGWPDHGAPEGKRTDDFEKMLNFFIDWNLKSRSEEIAVVHCSAGIGRTGTTICLMQLLINISSQINNNIENPKFSVYDTVFELRK